MTQEITIEAIELPPVSVELIEGENVVIIEISQPSAVGVVEVIHPGPQGPSGALLRRHDWAPPHDYLGTASLGATDSSAAWRITRLTINSAGAVTATGIATDVTWTGRTSHTYV